MTLSFILVLSQTERLSKWEAYENCKDDRLSDKTVFTQDRAFFGYVTNDKAEYDTIRQEYEHIIFTDRDNIDNTATVKGSDKFHEVRGEDGPDNNDLTLDEYDVQWRLHSSTLPCSCRTCHREHYDECSYRTLGDRACETKPTV